MYNNDYELSQYGQKPHQPYTQTNQPPYAQTNQPPYAQTNQIPYTQTNQPPYAQTNQIPYTQPSTYQTNYPPPPPQTYQTNYEYEPSYAPSSQIPEIHEPIVQGEKFGSGQWRDLPFLILFILHFVGVAIIIGFGVRLPADPNKGYLPTNIVAGDIQSEIIQIAILMVVAVVTSFLYLQFMKLFAATLIYLGIIFNILVFIGAAIYMGISDRIVFAVILGIFAIFIIFYFYMIRTRIPFAVEMIKTVVKTIQQYPATQVAALLSIVVQVAWLCVWFYAVVICQRFEDNYTYFASAFLIFSFYWTFEVIKNILHVTVSGLVATSYFMSDMMPANPTLDSAKRALTTSLGSICFGSLIVAVIKTIRTMVRMLRNEDNGILVFLVDCILGCIDSLVQYFNHYAFCQVAIYGKTFCQAAKSTWNLFKQAGLEAIANDNLIDGVLWMGVLFNALVTGAVGALLGGVLFDPHDSAGAVTMFIAGFLIGFVLMILMMQVVDSSVACSFVCFAENKEVLRNNNPELYQRLMETYNLSW